MARAELEAFFDDETALTFYFKYDEAVPDRLHVEVRGTSVETAIDNLPVGDDFVLGSRAPTLGIANSHSRRVLDLVPRTARAYFCDFMLCSFRRRVDGN